MPPSSTVALASGGSGLLTWFATHLLSKGTWDSCAPLITSAVAASRDNCDCPVDYSSLPTGEEAFPLFLRLVELVGGWLGDRASQFWVGICIGFCLPPVIDVLFCLKQIWQAFIVRKLRGVGRHQHGAAAHVYQVGG